MAKLLLRQYVTRIEELLQGDRCDEAIAHCHQVLHSFPWHGETHCLLGQAYLESEELQKAVESFRRALSTDPESLAAWKGLGRARDEQGLFLEAAWALRRALELAPGDGGVRAHLQHLCAQLEGVGSAWLELTPGALARLYLRNGLLAQAIDQARIACQGSMSWPGIQVALAEALWRAEQYPEAIETSLEILRSLPHCLKANLIAGAIRMRDGQPDAAEPRFRLAQAVDPENRVAQQLLGPELRLPAVEALIPEPETERSQPEAKDERQGRQPSKAEADRAAEPALPAAGAVRGEAPLDQPGGPAPEPAHPGDVPANLRALVEAGILDEVDLKVALAELAAIRSGAAPIEGLPDRVADLLAEGDLSALVQELILPSPADEAP